jgi:hypothetical protein
MLTKHTPSPSCTVFVSLVAFALGLASACKADEDRAVASGVQYLRSHAAGRGAGESAMIALALLKAEVPPSDPALQGCLATIRSRFTTGSYEPALGPGAGTYEAAATVMVLTNLDATENRGMIELVGAYLKSRQNANGSWDYSGRTDGDTSISQYAVLGMWEAENAGAPVSPTVWDHAAQWYLESQRGAGGWVYHRDSPSAETVSMTAAGIGSLMICRRQLDRYRQKRTTSSLLAPLVAESAHEDYHPATSNAQIDQGIKRGLAWLAANFAPSNGALMGPSTYYGLYGIERVGALGDRQTLGRVDWFAKGRDFIHSSQNADGSWAGAHGSEMNTVWAILFLTKSTAKTIRRITISPKLGAGTLLGGRELPKDLTSMTVAGGRVVSRPMNGAIEGMLAALEDPRAEQADAAVAGLVERYYVQGPGVLRPFKLRFRKMLSDRDVGVRQVAAWALSRTGDLDVVPALLGAMLEPNQDEDVVAAIRLGLQILSRKVQGMGPPSPSSREERVAAAQRWREWYQAIRPLDLEGQDDDASPADGPVSPVPPAAGSGSTAQ